MKKLKISYIGIGIVVLFVALILVIHFKNRKLQKYQNEKIEKLNLKYTTAKQSIQIKEKQIEDTISYYQKVLKRDETLLKEKNVRIRHFKERISTISGKIASSTSDEDYTFLMEILEPKADSLDFSFSANQIKQLAGDEMELQELRPLCGEYEQLTVLLSSQINYKDEIIGRLAEKENLLDEQIRGCEDLNKGLNKELKKANRRQKNTSFWNKALTVATGLAIITAILK